MKNVIHHSNLHDPMNRSKLQVKIGFNARNHPKVITVDKAEFNSPLFTKDPFVMYIVTSPGTAPDIFVGDRLQPRQSTSVPKYTMSSGQRPGLYELFQNVFYNGMTMAVKIGTFDNAQAALEAMDTYNHLGTTSEIGYDIHMMLLEFTDGTINVHDIIVGMLSLVGYRSSAKLQQLLGVVRTKHDDGNTTTDVSLALRDDLHKLKVHPPHINGVPNEIFARYSDLYDVFVLYDFFSDKVYHQDDQSLISFKEPIERIFKILSE